jgi:hypothetical protein
MDDHQFEAFIVHLDELLAQLVALGTRQVTLGERQERINAEQQITVASGKPNSSGLGGIGGWPIGPIPRVARAPLVLV